MDQQTPANEDSQEPTNPGNEDSRPKSRDEQIDEVVKLLAGDDQDTGDDDESGDDDQAPAKDEDSQKAGEKFETLDDIAKALKLDDVSALYDIAIKQAPGPDGEDRSVSLGELADLAKDRGQFELDRHELAESKRTQETKFMRAQQQLNEIIAMLPKRAISEELITAVSAKMTETQERERGLTLTAIPEWKDEQVEQSERAAIQKELTEYGFSDGYLDTVMDHRTLRYIRDNWQRKQRVDQMVALMRKKKPSSQRPSKPAGKHKESKPPARAQKGPKGQRQKVAAVAEILRSNEG